MSSLDKAANLVTVIAGVAAIVVFGERIVNPVVLPPGRDKLETRSAPSTSSVNARMGMVLVAF